MTITSTQSSSLFQTNNSLSSLGNLVPIQSQPYGVTGKIVATALMTLSVVTGGGIATEPPSTHSIIDPAYLRTNKPKAHLWLQQEVYEWLLQESTSNVTSEMGALRRLIQDVFGKVEVATQLYTDPDESWSKVQIQIFSHLSNEFEKQFILEDQLFLRIWESPSLIKLTQKLIISQV